MFGYFLSLLGFGLLALTVSFVQAQNNLSQLKSKAMAAVDAQDKLIQEIVDSLFSFSELGFQEFETQRYLTELLQDNGFEVELGVAGIPSAWWASWGSGEPVIAMGSDVDGIPRASQLPGVVYREPMIAGAPGHGEGHNSGQAINIVAALSHYVISNGGDQPNVVPSYASVWYFIREVSAEGIRENFKTLQNIARGAALMTDTGMTQRIVGAAYPRHFNKPDEAQAYFNDMQTAEEEHFPFIGPDDPPAIEKTLTSWKNSVRSWSRCITMPSASIPISINMALIIRRLNQLQSREIAKAR